MATAGLTVVDNASPRRHRFRRSNKPRKPPVPLRPLHRIWRRTIDGIQVVPVPLPVRSLSAGLAGLVACQISDLHVDRVEDLVRLEQAVRIINVQRPDLVFLTGDYFSGGDTMRHYLEDFRRVLSELNPAHGVFAILGNHDHWASAGMITGALKSSGATVLTNAHERLSIRGERLAIVGIDDLWSRRAEPARAFSGLKPEDCSIVLAHNPDTAPYLRPFAPGVMLSGHTHGGVVRIPYYGSLIRSILQIGQQYSAGLNRYNEFFIYTNRGLGTFWLRIRINCRPEVSRFTLTTPAVSPEDGARVPRRPGRRRSHRIGAV